jgi:2'-5' RNA ligase
MRLFVAADVGDRAKAQIRAIREQLIPALAASRRAPRVTWVDEDGAHVTLRFIGEVSDDCAAEIETALSQDFAVGPFEVQWDRLGTFPDGRSPRVLWIGASSGAEQLAELAELVDARLIAIVGPGESRPFKAHLTVGRIKEPGGFAWAEAVSRLHLEPCVTRVDHVTLYRSRLSPKGPTYTEVLRTPLKRHARGN